MSQLARRKLPDQLDSLNIYFCKIPKNATQKLLQNLTRSSLRQLSLVKIGLNEFSIPYLVEIIQS